jgi:hypothetical protein
MKKILFTIIILFPLTIFAQNLSFEQVLSLRTKTLSNLEEYLTSKKWEMLEATEPNENTMGSVDFAYNKSRFDDKAESFINFYYSNGSTKNNRLTIQVNKVSNYNLYLAKIKSLGYKLQRSYVEEGDLIKLYQTNNMTIRIRTSTQSDEFSSTRTTYSFFILPTSSYDLLDY